MINQLKLKPWRILSYLILCFPLATLLFCASTAAKPEDAAAQQDSLLEKQEIAIWEAADKQNIKEAANLAETFKSAGGKSISQAYLTEQYDSIIKIYALKEKVPESWFDLQICDDSKCFVKLFEIYRRMALSNADAKQTGLKMKFSKSSGGCIITIFSPVTNYKGKISYIDELRIYLRKSDGNLIFEKDAHYINGKLRGTGGAGEMIEAVSKSVPFEKLDFDFIAKLQK